MYKFVLLAGVVLTTTACDDGRPSPWIQDNGDLVEVVQLEGVASTKHTVFVVKSVKTGSLIKVVAVDKVVLVGEKWTVKWAPGGAGYHQFRHMVPQK